jgi:tetratricopeptide (TPR) repeat protein
MVTMAIIGALLMILATTSEALTMLPKTGVEQSLSIGRQIHQQECDYGFQTYGRGTPTMVPTKVWSDDHFHSFEVGKENAGPDEANLQCGDVIFQSKKPVFSPKDCQALIDEARQAITDGLGQQDADGNDNRPSNSELGEARVSTLPRAREWLKEELHSTLFPLLQDRFGVDHQLTLHDALIIGYGYFGGGSNSQPIHRDSSLISFNVALSPRSDYVGGGTYFQPLGKCLHQEQGHATCHAGGIMHAGRGIESGERWVLVLFVLDETREQNARRSHFLGLEAQRANAADDAKLHFDASLSVAHDNHLVYKDLGRTFMNEGSIAKARQSLAMAIQLYPADTEAAIALAKLLLQAKRPRAAIRVLDKLLEHLGDSDIVNGDDWKPLRAQGWEARKLAASCAIHLCQRRPLSYSSLLLPTAIRRLDICLAATPSPAPPFLLEMLEVANELHLQSIDTNTI